MKAWVAKAVVGLVVLGLSGASAARAAGCDDPNALITDAELKQVCDAKKKLGEIKGVIDKMTGQKHLPLGEPLEKTLKGVSGYLKKASSTIDSGLEIVSVLDDLNWAATTVTCMSQSTDRLEIDPQDRDARKGLAYGAAHLFTIFGRMMGASEKHARKRLGSDGLRFSTPLMAYAPAVLNARKIFLAVEHISSDCRGHRETCEALCAEPSGIRAWACSESREAQLAGVCLQLKEEYGDNIEGPDPKLTSVQDAVKRALKALPDEAVPNRSKLIADIDRAYKQVGEAEKWFRFGTDLEVAVCDAQQAITAAALKSDGQIYPIDALLQLNEIESCPWFVFYRDTIIRTWLRPLPAPPDGEARLLGMVLEPDARRRLRAEVSRGDVGELRIANSFETPRNVSLRFELGVGRRCGDNPAVEMSPTSQPITPGITRTIPFRLAGSLSGEVGSLVAGREPAWLCASVDVVGEVAAGAPENCVCAAFE